MRVALGVTLTCASVVPVRPAHAKTSAPDPVAGGDGDALRSELEALYTRGEDSFHAGDLDAAIEAFGAGVERLKAQRDPRLRAYFSVSLAIALLDRHEASGDAADVKRAHELLVTTVDRDVDVLRAEPRLEALARRNLERAREAMPAHPETVDGPAAETPAPPVETSTPDRVAAPPPAESPDVARRRAAGIGLLVSGTALIVGGIAVVVDGATLERRARAIAEDPPMGRQKEYIEEEVPRLARIRYAIAGPVLAVGTGLLVGGAILLHRARSRRRLSVVPALGPSTAGVTLRGAF